MTDRKSRYSSQSSLSPWSWNNYNKVFFSSAFSDVQLRNILPSFSLNARCFKKSTFKNRFFELTTYARMFGGNRNEERSKATVLPSNFILSAIYSILTENCKTKKLNSVRSPEERKMAIEDLTQAAQRRECMLQRIESVEQPNGVAGCVTYVFTSMTGAS